MVGDQSDAAVPGTEGWEGQGQETPLEAANCPIEIEIDHRGLFRLSVSPEAERSLQGLHPDEIVFSPAEADPSLARLSGDDEGGSPGGPVPPLSIVLMVAGTRGDVQPFIALGLGLQQYGHRVRLATHAVFREFVTGFGLEFYPLGGDPKVLSDFIVRNRGIVPTHSIKSAVDSSKEIRAVLFSTYKACTEADPGDPAPRPFTAQAIIANPPSYGHISCAEKLGIPLHMCFTMPWTPTSEFPSPLTHLSSKSRTLNKLSYKIISDFIFVGMSNMMNEFREEELGLPPLRTGNRGGTLVHQHQVPFMYCWSPAVVPKPQDWPAFADVVGYFFLEESSLAAYTPPPDLASFLAGGPPPVYVGFGSLMVDDPQGLTRMVVEAGKEVGVRLLLHKGWGGLGEGLSREEAGEGVFLLDTAAPHDWLFPRCLAVVHHGGAGTTAAGLKAGRPTTIIPFFGDQNFWGDQVHRMGLGPVGIPIDSLTAENLADALREMQRQEVLAAAQAAAERIAQEDGVANAVACFHRHLPLGKLLRGERVEWVLSRPHVYNQIYESGAGLVNVVRLPVKGYKDQGAKGAIKGGVKGVVDLGYRQVKGMLLSTQGLAEVVKVRRHKDSS